MRDKNEFKTIQVSKKVWEKIRRYAGPGRTIRITDWVEATILSEVLRQATIERALADKWTAKVVVPDDAKIYKRDINSFDCCSELMSTIGLKPEDYRKDSEIVECLESLGVKLSTMKYYEDGGWWDHAMTGGPFIHSRTKGNDGYFYFYKKTGPREFTFTAKTDYSKINLH